MNIHLNEVEDFCKPSVSREAVEEDAKESK